MAKIHHLVIDLQDTMKRPTVLFTLSVTVFILISWRVMHGNKWQ
jgi:hypothetical protein